MHKISRDMPDATTTQNHELTYKIIIIIQTESKELNITGVSATGTGGEYSGSPGSANLLTNCAIPWSNKKKNKKQNKIKAST